jgi:uncharacterized membrane protein YqaE (UPF0057 family)
VRDLLITLLLSTLGAAWVAGIVYIMWHEIDPWGPDPPG